MPQLLRSLIRWVAVLARAGYRTLPHVLRAALGARVTVLARPLLAQALPDAAPEIAPQAATRIGVVGLFRAPLGHARAAVLCAEELASAGAHVTRIDATSALNAPVDRHAAPATSGPESDLDTVVLVVNPDGLPYALNALGTEIVRHRRVIGYWVWELERAPSSWRGLADRVVHGIWAPSRFAAEALEAAFARPVQVVPHPVALAAFEGIAVGTGAGRTASSGATPHAARAHARKQLGVNGECFVALTSFAMSSSLARKNPIGAIRAFGDAFAGRTNVRLVVRCVGGKTHPAAFTLLAQAVRDARAPVTLVDEVGGRAALEALYLASDAYVSLHRSEGFGLNLAEAMLHGLPVVATGWSGNLDFMDGASAALVGPRSLIPVTDPQRIYTQTNVRWAEPDNDVAVAHLRQLAHDPDWRLRLGAAGERMARARLSGGDAARALGVAPGVRVSGLAID
jgi:glycosyltransferase involved in cell wall biosynthesis